MTRRKAGLVGAGITAVVVAVLAIGSVVIPRSSDTCVGNYEDANGGGDTMSICDVSISNVKVANLSTHTEGLHNGCNRGVNQSSTWNDCISSVRIANLPANSKLVLYQDQNYSGQVACVSTNGLTNITGTANDVTTSFRIIGGHC